MVEDGNGKNKIACKIKEKASSKKKPPQRRSTRRYPRNEEASLFCRNIGVEVV